MTVPADRTVVFSPFGLGVLDLAIHEFVYDKMVRSGELKVIDDFFHDEIDTDARLPRRPCRAATPPTAVCGAPGGRTVTRPSTHAVSSPFPALGGDVAVTARHQRAFAIAMPHTYGVKVFTLDRIATRRSR